MSLGTALVLIALGLALYKLPVLRKIIAGLLGLALVAVLIVGPYLWYQDRKQTAKYRELAAQREEVERAFHHSQKMFPGRTITLDMRWSTPDTPAPDGIHKFDWDPQKHWGQHSQDGSNCEMTWYAPVSEAEKESRQTATDLGRRLACYAYDRCFGSNDGSLIEPCRQAVAAGHEFSEKSEAQKAAAEELRKAQEEIAKRRAQAAARTREAEKKAEAAANTAPSAATTNAYTLLRQGSYEASARASSLAFRKGVDGKFSIQALTACAPATVRKVVENVDDDRLFLVPVSFQGRDCYRVCWGLFGSASEAELALRELPAYFHTLGVSPGISPLAELLP